MHHGANEPDGELAWEIVNLCLEKGVLIEPELPTITLEARRA